MQPGHSSRGGVLSLSTDGPAIGSSVEGGGGLGGAILGGGGLLGRVRVGFCGGAGGGGLLGLGGAPGVPESFTGVVCGGLSGRSGGLLAAAAANER